MQHSIIGRALKRIFEFIKKYYSFSFTSKMINGISNTLRSFFLNSVIYRLFVNESRNSRNFRRYSLVGRSEGLFQKIISFLNPFYKKGVQGSFVLKSSANIESSKKRVMRKSLSLIIIGAVLSFNLFSIINRSLYVEQIYISVAITFLTINIYFIDIDKLYKNSLVKKIFDGIFDI